MTKAYLLYGEAGSDSADRWAFDVRGVSHLYSKISELKTNNPTRPQWQSMLRFGQKKQVQAAQINSQLRIRLSQITINYGFKLSVKYKKLNSL